MGRIVRKQRTKRRFVIMYCFAHYGQFVIVPHSYYRFGGYDTHLCLMLKCEATDEPVHCHATPIVGDVIKDFFGNTYKIIESWDA